MDTLALLGKYKWQILAGTQALCLVFPKLLEKFEKCHCKSSTSEEENLPELLSLSP